MRAVFWILALGAIASAALAASLSRAEQPVPLSLTRLDCGEVQVNDLNAFSDTDAYAGQTKRLTDSCYLIRHGDSFMLWDTGLPAALKGKETNSGDPMSPTLSRTLKEQLAQLGVKPEQISIVGISHYHFDHTGQASEFPQAKLIIGKGDWDALNGGEPPFAAGPKGLAPWLAEGGSVEPIEGDKDIFGDGSVLMLDMRGHTPGHHSLLLSLPETGKILLTGDVAHFHENYDSNGIPDFNTNRADSLASLDRFRQLAKNLGATVIIQHDARDIAKLPAFPKAAN
ncbi:MAG: N-acyl homoserine lactonase family protein [Sphingobium sp.]